MARPVLQSLQIAGEFDRADEVIRQPLCRITRATTLIIRHVFRDDADADRAAVDEHSDQHRQAIHAGADGDSAGPC